MFPSRDPFDRIARIRKALQNMSDESADPFGGSSMMSTYIDQSVDEDEGVLSVVMDIPGVSKEDIDAKVQEHRNRQWLTVEATNDDGNMKRQFRQQIGLKRHVDTELATSEYNNGVLTVEFPLLESSGDDGVSIDIN